MTDKNPYQILHELIDGLTQASGGASQLIHQHQDPRLMMVREAIELTKSGCMSLSPHNEFVAPKTVIVGRA